MSNIVDIVGTTRFGRIHIDATNIKGGEKLILAAMGRIIPLTTTFNKDNNMIEYLAISEDFDELESDELIPRYIVENFSDGSVRFKRASYKRKINEDIKDEIMNVIMGKNVNMEAFKAYMRRFTNATDEDFQTYNNTLLEALNLYVTKRENGQL